jgi:hypothetical protein
MTDLNPLAIHRAHANFAASRYCQALSALLRLSVVTIYSMYMHLMTVPCFSQKAHRR